MPEHRHRLVWRGKYLLLNRARNAATRGRLHSAQVTRHRSAYMNGNVHATRDADNASLPMDGVVDWKGDARATERYPPRGREGAD